MSAGCTPEMEQGDYVKLIHPSLFFVYFRVDIGILAVLNESRINKKEKAKSKGVKSCYHYTIKAIRDIAASIYQSYFYF
jgi:hypothetical protein